MPQFTKINNHGCTPWIAKKLLILVNMRQIFKKCRSNWPQLMYLQTDITLRADFLWKSYVSWDKFCHFRSAFFLIKCSAFGSNKRQIILYLWRMEKFGLIFLTENNLRKNNSCLRRSVTAMNDYDVEWLPDQNMVTDRPYITPFVTILVALERSRSQLSNSTNIVTNGAI